ncbi:MAG: hypothetical protein M1833_001557 [Piccolia ochrophora]|nr:MAG: hypothetical protein M1833_001557 [Piccolia ochrophora]
MSCPLVALPPELQEEALEFIRREPFKTLINLSCTCSFYRSRLAPELFGSISLRNSTKSGLSVQALAKSSHCNLVAVLFLDLFPPGQAEDGESSSETASVASSYAATGTALDTEDVFPGAVRAILSDLRHFPNLQALRIQFLFYFEERAGWGEPYYNLSDEESLEQVQIEEQTRPWRALTTRVFEAIGKNKDHSVGSLEISQLPLKEISAYSNQAFQDFLGTVEHFGLSL